MDAMTLKREWLREEEQAHIHGWDFSHVEGRCVEEELPWNYRDILLSLLRPEDELLDIETGGGEFLLSLNHPHEHTAASEGYPPNVSLCREKLLPLGVDFREMRDASNLPYPAGRFDLVMNRHGSFDAGEIARVLKPGGRFVTQQVGEDNDRELVRLLLPGAPKPFPGMNLAEQRRVFEEAGFRVTRAEECFRPIRFYDVGALVWFARIIEWEFPGFSVEGCLDRLMEAQALLEEKGALEGRIHRYLIVAEKRG